MIQIGRHQLDADCVADRLYQGSAIEPDVWPVLGTTFSMVVLCAEEVQPALPTLRIDVVRAGFNDTPWPTSKDLATAASAARTVGRELARGGRVLVTCAAGLNRSGLVVGLVLGQTLRKGADPSQTMAHGDAVIRLIRRARGDAALGNPAFYRIVRECPLGVVLEERRTRARSDSDSEVSR